MKYAVDYIQRISRCSCLCCEPPGFLTLLDILKQPISFSPHHLRGNECHRIEIGSLSLHWSYIISNVYVTLVCRSTPPHSQHTPPPPQFENVASQVCQCENKLDVKDHLMFVIELSLAFCWRSCVSAASCKTACQLTACFLVACARKVLRVLLTLCIKALALHRAPPAGPPLFARAFM